MNNILDFGAIGDGKTINTKAIQSAIDMGGTVYIPKGEFVTGTLYLKSNSGLHFENGAILKASHDHNDYNAPDFCPQNEVFESENMAGTHLISAINECNISISGFGTIDGDSHFWVNENNKLPNSDFFNHPPKEANRPAQMIYFAECKNIKITDINLVHSPFWHLFFHGCEDVIVKGVNIKGENKQWVNDGIDIDSCKRVTISDSIIDTGDDAITLRAHSKRLVKSDGICEDIVINNCILKSHLDFGVRIGVGDGIIRNAMFSNIVIRDSLKGIGIINRFTPRNEGVSIENIHFKNISISSHETFVIRTCNQENFTPTDKPYYTQNITFDGICAHCDRGSYVTGYENTNISDIKFRNVDMHFSKENPNNDRKGCNWRDVEHKDAPLYIRNAKDISLNNMRLYIEDEGNFTDEIIFNDTENISKDVHILKNARLV